MPDPRQLSSTSTRVRPLLVARALRALGDGCISVILPVHLTMLGFTPFQVGAIATATLLGSGLLTLLVGLQAYRFRYRTLLLIAAVIMAFTGVGFASLTAFWPIVLIALVGTLNPSSGDVSVFLPMEQAVLSHVVSDRERTAVFAHYSLVGALAGAVGALLAGAPELAARHWQMPLLTATQAVFAIYGLLGVACSLIYRGLPANLASDPHRPAAPLTQSRRIVFGLAALFSLDAFAGGFLVQSLLALWLFQRFQLSPAMAGLIFFWTGVMSALSYLAAVRIAQRIGLLRTMVFTHLPSSVVLLLIPFISELSWVVALLLARSALSQMDVPTRTSYVMAVVTPGERAAAASITSVPRSLAASISPLIAGYLLGISSFAWFLFVAGALKIAYDLLLLVTFRHVRPPEEVQASATDNRRSSSPPVV
ncbi:MAG: MFS transporter [Pseudomonadota bacterium]|nr:MFS transporter [Pseudomonadota bacterium]